MEQRSTHPALVLLTSHWLSMAGAALVTTAALSWILVVLLPAGTGSENPYVGIVTFFLLPALFFAGLALMPAGMWLAKRRIRNAIGEAPMDRGTALRRLAIFLTVTTLANLLFATQFTYRAVEHMETVNFCGQSCHVMQPEFRAYQVARHNRVACVECHVAPGASGWVAAKTAGTRQLYEVITNSHERPIPSAMESNRLVASVETCERCHSRTHTATPRVRVLPKYAADERNTVAYTVMMLRVGGGSGGGIHGAHLNPDVEIRYAASDPKRQTIPWVEWRNKRTGATRQYLAKGAKTPPEAERHGMQCVDCHNRPAHSFEKPEGALDRAISAGAIAPSLPWVKKTASELLTASYASQEAASDAIAKAFQSRYGDRPEAKRAAAEVTAIFARNVFPDLKVSWGTYPNNLGHTDSPGCFRCHDGEHSSKDGQSIAQDCASCHEMLAVEEADPEVLKKLNLSPQPQGETK